MKSVCPFVTTLWAKLVSQGSDEPELSDVYGKKLWHIGPEMGENRSTVEWCPQSCFARHEADQPRTSTTEME